MMMQSEALFLSVFPEKNENENESEVENESERESGSECESECESGSDRSQSDSVSKGKDNKESDSEESKHQLDKDFKVPSTFLELTNQNFDRICGAKEGVCDFNRDDDGKRKIIIPEISRRCLVTWPIGAKLGAGAGVVVYKVDCPRRGKCKKVARISQLRNPVARAHCVRDGSLPTVLSVR
jgi:hypothetical protein